MEVFAETALAVVDLVGDFEDDGRAGGEVIVVGYNLVDLVVRDDGLISGEEEQNLKLLNDDRTDKL